MLNLETRRVIHTRDIIWMNQTYGQYKNITATKTVNVDDSDDKDDDETSNSETGRDKSTDQEVIIVDAK